jgi:calcineurin-like phosphoesterase family protein
MKTYFTADFHFKHNAIIKYANRPFKSLEEMHETLINNFNKVVGPNDLTYFLGDMCFSTHPEKDKELISRLNGRKILILGNHDAKDANIMMRAGFDLAVYSAEIKIAGERVLLCHRPYKKPFRLWGWLTGKWRKKWYKKNPTDNGLFLLHGHSHNKPEYKIRGKMYDCGVDGNNFKPIGIWEIGNWISEYKQKRR